jgi:hypothetical protein
MSRDISSQYGAKYLLNTNTGVAHNLTENEDECRIDEIKKEQGKNFLKLLLKPLIKIGTRDIHQLLSSIPHGKMLSKFTGF